MPEGVEPEPQNLREHQSILSHIDTLPFVLASCLDS